MIQPKVTFECPLCLRTFDDRRSFDVHAPDCERRNGEVPETLRSIYMRSDEDGEVIIFPVSQFVGYVHCTEVFFPNGEGQGGIVYRETGYELSELRAMRRISKKEAADYISKRTVVTKRRFGSLIPEGVEE